MSARCPQHGDVCYAYGYQERDGEIWGGYRCPSRGHTFMWKCDEFEAERGRKWLAEQVKEAAE